MPLTIPPSCALRALATLAALAVAGCGSSSSTHSAASPLPADTATTQSAPSTSSTSTSSAPKTAPSTQTTSPGATGGAAAAGTAPTGTSVAAAGLTGAEAVVARLGYTVANPADYHSSQTLRVLVGVQHGSADARVQRAFFFVNDRYLGTDTSDRSAGIAVVGQDDTGVTLRYSIYRHGQPLCCPSSTSRVRYMLDNGRLLPAGPIPSSAARNGT